MNTIIIADDHPYIRTAIKALSRELRVLAECETGVEAVARCEELTPEFAILDISMPGMNGIEATRQIQVVSPRTKIIILSVYREIRYVRESIEAGALAYLCKDDLVEHLSQCFQYVAKDEIYLSPHICAEMLDIILSKTFPSVLTSRERQITQLLEQGAQSGEIAKILGIEISTLRRHKANMYKKLKRSDEKGIVEYALREKLIVPSRSH